MTLSIIDKTNVVVKTQKHEVIICVKGVKCAANRVGWVSTARPLRSTIAMWHFFSFGIVFIR